MIQLIPKDQYVNSCTVANRVQLHSVFMAVIIHVSHNLEIELLNISVHLHQRFSNCGTRATKDTRATEAVWEVGEKFCVNINDRFVSF